MFFSRFEGTGGEKTQIFRTYIPYDHSAWGREGLKYNRITEDVVYGRTLRIEIRIGC